MITKLLFLLGVWFNFNENRNASRKSLPPTNGFYYFRGKEINKLGKWIE